MFSYLIYQHSASSQEIKEEEELMVDFTDDTIATTSTTPSIPVDQEALR